MARKFLAVFLLCIAVNADAGVIKVLKYVWGTSAPSSITFYPYGRHFRKFFTKQANYDLQLLVGVTFRGFVAGTFTNSHRKQTYFVGVDRYVYDGKRVTVGYLLGIMHGYGTELRDALGPVLGGDPGPVFALYCQYHVTKRFSLSGATYGAGILVGMNYRLV